VAFALLGASKAQEAFRSKRDIPKEFHFFQEPSYGHAALVAEQSHCETALPSMTLQFSWGEVGGSLTWSGGMTQWHEHRNWLFSFCRGKDCFPR